jgi:flagellin-like hook-associated protein FlgL
MEATIIWQEDNTTGAYFISGFENLTVTTGSNSDSKSTSSIGDTFSFATGSKSFLDHRDENGDLINVSYLGGDESSRAMVGTETELSFLLDASNQGTESLGDVVNTLVDLRNGLLNPNSISFAEEVQTAERELISSEDDLVDKMGELAASLTRIETVNSHDEEYSLSIDKQIANDLEVDLSEAIMRLSRVSMAYQAAMQVGSQMLNNSLLNYL